MSGFSMMFIGAALCILAWSFVHYHGVSTLRVFVFAVGAALFTKGTVQVMVALHSATFGG